MKIVLATALLALQARQLTDSPRPANETDRVSMEAAKWKFEQRADPMTDRQRAQMTLAGEGGLLMIGCDGKGKNKPYLLLTTDVFLGDGYRRVMARLDAGSASITYWRFGDSTAWIADGAKNAEMVETIKFAKVIRFRLPTYRGAAVDLAFEADPKDTTDAFSRVAAACG